MPTFNLGMVFRILKNIVKAGVLLTIGAGIGIWFAPPTAKLMMKQKLGVAQVHSKKLQDGANKLWTTSLQKKLSHAASSLDPRKIDRKTVDGWVASGKNAVATISTSAKQTQETISKANQVLQTAKHDYKEVGTMFGM